MPFHVEVSASPNHARVFNLDQAALLATVLEPWTIGLPFEFGEQEWEPRKSRLTILEGPRLEGPDLAFGQGWANARRVSEDATRRVLEAAEASAPVRGAATIAAESLAEALEKLGSGEPAQPLGWPAAAERIDGRDPEVAAVILVVRPSRSGLPQS
jgi:hypothetical protein